MDSFVVSARKYRPATFDQVVGQSSIVSTLKNAIRNHQVAHSFLFCGPRGTGKTTCARILAKTINCQNLTKEIEACNECVSCKAFDSGQALNVDELDAASNNSVDDIRNLVSRVLSPPRIGTKKVYIIDEVHMLSQSAFNALLKTLEEPPPHAIFILATTEKHKILPTILSRCQIFSFNRITVNDIVQHLEKIAKTENIAYEPDALHIIAQKADGGLRDALSIFDQLVTFSNKNLTYQSVIGSLNVLDSDYYFKATNFLLEKNIPDSLMLLNEILAKGFDEHNFVLGLGEHFRNLLLCKNAATLTILETSEKNKALYLEQTAKCSDDFLLCGLEVINDSDIQYKASKNKRLLIELCLLKLCSENLADLKKKSFAD
jgi:DNA polymerase-3 subunit gamma/tau